MLLCSLCVGTDSSYFSLQCLTAITYARPPLPSVLHVLLELGAVHAILSLSCRSCPPWVASVMLLSLLIDCCPELAPMGFSRPPCLCLFVILPFVAPFLYPWLPLYARSISSYRVGVGDFCEPHHRLDSRAEGCLEVSSAQAAGDGRSVRALAWVVALPQPPPHIFHPCRH